MKRAGKRDNLGDQKKPKGRRIRTSWRIARHSRFLSAE